MDIGTGTGLLSLMLAQQNVKLIITAIEKDILSCNDAAFNFSNSIFSKQINLIQNDVFDTVLQNNFYDVIICNPPFFKNQLKSNDIKKNIAWHNNTLPLKKLLNLIQLKLNSNGDAFLLLSPMQKNELDEILSETDLSIDKIISLKSKLSKQPHVFFIKLNLKKNRIADIKEFIVRDEHNSYTDKIKCLTKDFYL